MAENAPGNGHGKSNSLQLEGLTLHPQTKIAAESAPLVSNLAVAHKSNSRPGVLCVLGDMAESIAKYVGSMWMLQFYNKEYRILDRIHRYCGELLAYELELSRFILELPIATQERAALMLSRVNQKTIYAAWWLAQEGNRPVQNIKKEFHSLMYDIHDQCGPFHQLATEIRAAKILAAASPQLRDGPPLVEAAYPAEHFRVKCGIPPNTLNKARREGRLRAEKIGDRWYYKKSDIQRVWPDAFGEESDE